MRHPPRRRRPSWWPALALALALAPLARAAPARDDDAAGAPAAPALDDDAPALDDGAPSDAPPTGPAPVDAAPADDDDRVDDADGLALPDALPPLDPELEALLQGDAAPLTNAFGGVAVLAHGRLRLEIDESRDLAPAPDLQYGLTGTGRVGVEVPLGASRARVVVGDGRRLGRDDGNLPLPIVPRAPLGFLYELVVRVEVPAFGVASSLALGRQEVVVADGRLIGRAPFDPRGRTLDGAVLAAALDDGEVRAGAFFTGPYTADALAGPHGLAFVDGRIAWSSGDATGYTIVARDGGGPTTGGRTTPTVGSRARARLLAVEAKGGLDVQTALSDGRGASVDGAGLHGELDLALAPTLDLFAREGTPFLGVRAESTGAVGDATFRAPAGDVHAYLGALDLVAMENVSEASLYAGLRLLDAGEARVAGRVLALTDVTRGARDVKGALLVDADLGRTNPLLFTELDAAIVVHAGHGLTLTGEYGIAFPGPARGGTRPVQRLLVSLGFERETTPPLP